MAIDGSFQIDKELTRLLHRCPKLTSTPVFQQLITKGNNVGVEEVVNAVGQLVLHPNYTIPLLGCFRPIADKILHKAISILEKLSKIKHNLSIRDKKVDDDKFLREDEQAVYLIDVYDKFGMILSLHELACFAFVRAIDLNLSLLGSVQRYFTFAPPPFVRIQSREQHGGDFNTGENRLLNVARISYRFLWAKPQDFTRKWDWSCFMHLRRTDVVDTKWCAIQICMEALTSSDAVIEEFGLSLEESYHCLSRWKEFISDVSLEKASWYIESSAEKKSDPVLDEYNYHQRPFLQPCSVASSADRTVISSSTYDQLPSSSGRPFVLTSAVNKSYEMAFLAVSQRGPVLLYGPAGSGKTALVKKLGQDNGSRVLFIHMDEQMDGKTLLGSYVCTENPGEFRWQPGSLTQAVHDGFWVVFEDIDKAPPDIQSILLPLLEGATTFSTGYGEAITVNEDFRLFSTVTCSKLSLPHAIEGDKSSFGALWRRVAIRLASKEDLLKVVHAWFPMLDPIAEKLIETFEKVNEFAGPHSGFMPASSGSKFSLRDLLKWCKRISDFGSCFEEGVFSTYMLNRIYNEAVDIFASFSIKVEKRLALMKEIARVLKVTLYPANKPTIEERKADIRIGRVTLPLAVPRSHMMPLEKKPFVEIHSSVHVLEKIACSVKYNEPVLLVGETGTGKTTLVQNLATRLGHKLTVMNLSQQSDAADLLGGFKPLNAQFVCMPLYGEFQILFSRTFSLKDNEKFIHHLNKSVVEKNWKQLLDHCHKVLQKLNDIRKPGPGKKRKRAVGDDIWKAWDEFSLKLESVRAQISSSGMIFSFIEGAFVTALKNGEWILLDEVNLAPVETLQRIIGVIEEGSGSLCLTERGDVHNISRHSDFRIFACMNPATDAGKRDLPPALRGKFTEYYVDDVLNDEDLMMFINQFIGDNYSNIELASKVMQFYIAARKEAEERLQDGANMKPQFSLRSLYRALEYMRKARKEFGFEKAMHDGFHMFFVSLLNAQSASLMKQLISSHLLGGKDPRSLPFHNYLTSPGFIEDDFVKNYVLSKSVEEHLSNLACAISVHRYPVLLQGPTSSGKTSLVQYLAAITGHEFVRINNHEHTDLQEYLGSYITDSSGKLSFHEGALTRAVRQGSWIVLDELNLAPSDVLEALNRLLDDNRELFIPELSETIRAHPNFMLFATQNPPMMYGGRKILSRAFRNRFVEIHVEEIPNDELSTILEKRCQIPQTYAEKMIHVMKKLQLHRQSSKIFAGKHGFITPRDLFRWANRFRSYDGKCYEDLAHDGYYLMAERLRNDNEKKVVQQVLEKHLSVKLATDDMYKLNINSVELKEGQDDISKLPAGPQGFDKIIWTKSMQRLYFLIERCYKLREPVLLVGETGGGKTTVCQMLSYYFGSELRILNCHQYTETSDFLGGFYPVRDRSNISSDFKEICQKLMSSKALIHHPGDTLMSSDINQASQIIAKLSAVINSYRQGLVSHHSVTEEEICCIEQLVMDLIKTHRKWQTIFTWQDGPLIEAMRTGDMFLVDEISLADDSVLERLNSVLEPERKLTLAEKGGTDLERITAHPKFFLLATMNPGGDYGKKELSPALRNRFTEIWVPSTFELDELRSIAVERLSSPQLREIADVLLNFWEWFNQLGTGRMLNVRDLLAWVSFINATWENLGPESACLHGALLVLLDGLSLGTNVTRNEAADLRAKCLSFLLDKLKYQEYKPSMDYQDMLSLEVFGSANPELSELDGMQCDTEFGIHPFYIKKGCCLVDDKGFEFHAPTTRRNARRVLRAMQLVKPVLLEGSPGVGKTSLIVALGKYSGHTVVRINLSEQTDMMDLLGSDLPIESDDGVQFAWSDGILLQAIKNGSWVLLDELNLAPQSVLEGLNAILDHRAEVFIPELGHCFKCHPSFRVFACQNPASQGGGRKGLPKSFLNRFTKVYVDELVEDDYMSICCSLFPSISESIRQKLVVFNKKLYEDIMVHHKFAQVGSPWEFNLRDVIRSCEIIQGAPDKSKYDCFLNTVYVQRMRTKADRQKVLELYESVFGPHTPINVYPRVHVNPKYLVVGNVSLERHSSKATGKSVPELKILPGLCHSLEAVAHAVKQQWLCVLVGPASSGKTSLVRVLSQLTGNVLNELNLSSTSEISELLGCFEQYNALRNFRSAISQIERYINEYCSLNLDMSTEEFAKREDLMSLWLSFISKIGYNSPVNTASTSVDSSRMRYFNFIEDIVKIIEDWSKTDLSKILKEIKKCEEDYKGGRYSRKFEWVSGLLIKAIENGEWIVLENANLCNPTVLDRINSLVEQSGSITVNECGLVEGKPLVLHPHPHFRMFLTVNPAHGEISRAMRNRGVEIFMMPPTWQLDEKDNGHSYETELEEVKRFVVLSGIPVGRLINKISEAHIYAKHEGSKLHVSITNLELARWIQLFQRLVTNGNQALWSLQISFEHTYLSCLGEGSGNDIVTRTTLSYLSLQELSRFDSSQDRLLCSPGGWPTPIKLRDFVYYSRETSVRQNCVYVEFLGVLLATHSFSNAVPAGVSFYDIQRLYALMFPKESMPKSFNEQRGFSSALVKKMLAFSADWTMEQAVESDFELYLLWFKKFGFQDFINVIEKERRHRIWIQILQCRHELIADGAIDVDQTPVPVLSSELINLSAVGQESKASSLLEKSIIAEGLLRRSIYQWSLEGDFGYSEKTKVFEQILKSLQRLEEKVLDLLVEPPLFDSLFELYSELLDHHLLLWNGIISSEFDCLVVSMRALQKDVTKLEKQCPEKLCPELELFRVEIESSSCYDKCLLRAYGGHPPLPSNEDVYTKHSQVLTFWEEVWPRKTKLEELNHIEGVLSVNPELRSLTLQGVSMSSYIVRKTGDIDLSLQHLEDMYQMLMQRLHSERHRLEIVRVTEQTNLEPDLDVCCSFSPDMLCRKSAYNSWMETVPLINSTSFFVDTELLEKLTRVASLDVKEQYLSLSDLSSLLETAARFSHNLSSRPPTDFCPHQKIMWTLDAWNEVQPKDWEISSFTFEMWLNWHKFLWTSSAGYMQNSTDSDNQLPDWLFKPLKMVITNRILQGATAIRHYHEHSLKLKVASRALWEDNSKITDEYGFLLSAAQHVFQCIIHGHRKSFSEETYAEIKCCFHGEGEEGLLPGGSKPSVRYRSGRARILAKEHMLKLSGLLALSKHHTFSSLLDDYIKPVLHKLYESVSKSISTVGCAWLLIGCMHYHLLICSNDVDPTVKYYIKYKHLMEKIASLELENDVRETCVRLSGCFKQSEICKHRKKCQDLKAEAKRLYQKVVFRSHPEKFKELKNECDGFLEEKVGQILECMYVEKTSSEVMKNLQETITGFIEGLSRKYPSYSDIVEPVQVALYEIKLGLSLIKSDLCKKSLQTLKNVNIEATLDTVYSFMRFPEGPPARAVAVKACSWQLKLPSCDVTVPTSIKRDDRIVLEKLLLTSSNDEHCEDSVSALQLKTDLLKNLLLKAMHKIFVAQFMDNESFMFFDEVFAEFGDSWIPMKLQVKDKESSESQQFKFKPRAFRISNIMEVDLSSLKNSIEKEILFEWHESLQDGVSEETPNKETAETQDDWRVLEGSLLKDIIDIYNQLFGTMYPRLRQLQLCDADRESSFIGSYRLGVRMIEGLEGILTSGFDVKLMPEHLFLISLEHEHKFSLSYQSAQTYNFYKDPNAVSMAKLVRLLENLKGKILILLNGWEGGDALQRVIDVIDMVLTIPLDTPLAKAFSGVEFLLNRVTVLHETVKKFPLSDELDPIYVLLSSWYKLEFECWPTLLDEVQTQFDVNAEMLWFPLYSVLRRTVSTDTTSYIHATIQSLEDFIRMSSIGEFKKRLQLLLAFHGHIRSGQSRGCNSFPHPEETKKVLYNTFGFYMQFLPIISNQVEANRRGIELELKDCVKLCRWKHIDNYLAIESCRRTRQKLKKIIHKYSDLLNQPIILILSQAAARSGIPSQPSPGENLLEWSCQQSLNDVCDQIELLRSSRPPLFADREKEVESVLQKLGSVLQKLGLRNQNESVFKDVEGFASTVDGSILPDSIGLRERREDMWKSVKKLCSELSRDEKITSLKRRVFSDLLKLLRRYGLTRHRSSNIESESMVNQNSWVLQPSYDLQHLLSAPDMNSSEDVGSCAPRKHAIAQASLETEFRSANQYYFKGIASVHDLQQICSNFHKDFTLEQVQRAVSYLNHLIEIQQEQRAAAYGFSDQLKCLREHMWPLFSISNSVALLKNEKCCYTQKQYAYFQCMWRQKQLLDNLCIMVHDECLLLQRVEDHHVDSCASVKDAARQLRLFIENFVRDFKKSKDCLDNHLLGSNRVDVVDKRATLHPYGLTEDMVKLVYRNFDLLRNFEEGVRSLDTQKMIGGSVKRILLEHYDYIFKEVKSADEELRTETMTPRSNLQGENTTEFEAEFGEAAKRIYTHFADAFGWIMSRENGSGLSEGSPENIILWKDQFVVDMAKLNLSPITDELEKIIINVGKLFDFPELFDSPGEGISIQEHLEKLYLFSSMILDLSGALLHEFLIMHRMMSRITLELADTLASLFAKGFGVVDDQAAEGGKEQTKDACGTGLGEGTGLNDVSDQIEDEDQLQGTSEKPNETQDALTNPSENVKGIEMEQDFDAETFSVSEDSDDDDDDNSDINEDEKPESAMGETGANGEAVDEKLGDNEDDENLGSTNEKSESAPSGKDSDITDMELRAKEDGDAIDGAQESDLEMPNDEDEGEASDDMNDANINEEEAVPDSTTSDACEPQQNSREENVKSEPQSTEEAVEDGDDGEPEDMEHDGLDDIGSVEEEDTHENLEANEKNDQEMSNSVDETSDAAETDKMEDDGDGANLESDLGNKGKDTREQKKEALQSCPSSLLEDNMQNVNQCGTQPKGDSEAAGLSAELMNGEGGEQQDHLAPVSGVPDTSINESVKAHNYQGKRISQQPETPLLQDESLPINMQPNPCRSIGDALDGWKEKVKVSFDLDKTDMQESDDKMDEQMDEYGYTAEFEKGTAQALGPATIEQTENNVKGSELDKDSGAADRDDHVTEMEIDEKPSETCSLSSNLNFHNNIERLDHLSKLENEPEVSLKIDGPKFSDSSALPDSLVSIKSSHVDEPMKNDQISTTDDELGKVNDYNVSGDMIDAAASSWRKYELATSRLSQELAEQLRLVMEPTLANKLQGDYKTGKRINMKKVIPYIASHYRKDKIWLRRTRPNKRDYQVLIAVDDSRSMLESGCGDVATEALVTVCRAMSQLEVGNLGVCSFGKKGNIRLLHDFDQPFTGEAGTKMVSSLTFQQENTIADGPVVDLLTYINNKLDDAIMNARLPSGDNPQQLILIIADGWFHEKDLRRYVRDTLSKKRMVAFLLLDPEDSMIDMKKATFKKDGELIITKYMDSFPFPYYVVLRDIQSLPQTLSDLLRQWFELMQYEK